MSDPMDLPPGHEYTLVGHEIGTQQPTTITFHFTPTGGPEKTVTLAADSVEIVGMELDEAAAGFWKMLPEYNPLRWEVEALANKVMKTDFAFRGLQKLFHQIHCIQGQGSSECPNVHAQEHDLWCAVCSAKAMINAQLPEDK